MFSYYAYGIGIHSEIKIPEFISSSKEADTTITIKSDASLADYLPEAVLEQPWALHLSRESAIVYVKDTGVFLINEGKTIVFIPAPEATEQVTRFYLVGTVMAILLYQRRFLVLHGSVIDIDGQAIIFLGNSGDGKSSTAAALHAGGHNLINDDVAPITLEQGRAIVQPGFPQIKMSRETATALNYDFESLPHIHPKENKRGYRPKYNSVPQPMKVGRIYVLEYGEEFAVESISASLAVKELSRHSRPTTLYHKGDALHFFQCANLVKQQTIYRLIRPKKIELLPQIVEFIVKDLAKESKTARSPLHLSI
ncbi:MAG: hypothetical protein Tsb0014_00120 [Pleurocapsa sp.]